MQAEAHEFVNSTAKQALDVLVDGINREPDCTATVEATIPPEKLGRVKFAVFATDTRRAQRPKGDLVFVFLVVAARYLDTPRVICEAGPMMVDDEPRERHQFDLAIPGVGVTTHATADQVGAYVRPLFQEALQGYRVRRYYKGS